MHKFITYCTAAAQIWTQVRLLVLPVDEFKPFVEQTVESHTHSPQTESELCAGMS